MYIQKSPLKQIICVEIFFDVEYYNNMILLLSVRTIPNIYSDPHIAITSHDEQDCCYGEEVGFLLRLVTPTMLLKTFNSMEIRLKCTLSLGDSR